MEKIRQLVLLMLLISGGVAYGQADPGQYLAEIKEALGKQWPNNRTINLVFHGHSVPSGYFRTPQVNTMDAYPHQTLRLLKETYPNAVINTIVTAIGGENSASGVQRMSVEVLPHRPDVLFIDYGLNDRGIGRDAAEAALRQMIDISLTRGIKVILLTPSPDLSVDWGSPDGSLWEQRQLILALAEEYGIGVVDVFGLFLDVVASGKDVSGYMSQSNHPNALGHQLIAEGIAIFFNRATTAVVD